MKCWICGEVADTGEHRLKASDLRDHFRPISQNDPIYLHLGEKKNIPIGSVKNARLKSRAQICANCNNKRTQPYDVAWEKVSKYLRSNWACLKNTKTINLSFVFPADTKKSLVDVHLYFVKLFGCMIVEYKIPVEIKTFSNCLIHRQPHRNLFIGFGPVKAPYDKNIAAITPINSVNIGGKSIFANFLYVFNDLAVNIIYNEVNGNDAVLKNTWHPSQKSTTIKTKQLKT